MSDSSDIRKQQPRAGAQIDSYVDWLGIEGGADRRRFLATMGKGMLAISAAGALPGVLAACSKTGSASAGPGGKSHYRVAFIIFVNNPYWQETQVQIQKLLKPRLARQNVKVDLVNATASANAVDMSNAINSAMTQQYDGIIVAGLAPSMAPAINNATKKGIPVFTFCCDVPGSKRVAFYGPDNNKIGADCAKLMAQGLKEERILEKRGLESGVIGLETALGVSSLVDRTKGFAQAWAKIGPKNVKLLPFIDVKDNAQLVYSQSRDTISAHPNLVGLYLSTGSQYALGNALIDANKTSQVIAIAHEVFEPTLKVMLKGGIWAVTNDAPIGQVIPPGDDMARLLKTKQKPRPTNFSTSVKKYFVYAKDREWIDQELKHWHELFTDCHDGCPQLVSKELKNVA